MPRRRLAVIGAAIVVIIAIVVVIAASRGGSDSRPADAAPEGGAGATRTEKVERTDLAATEDVSGTLGYDDSRSVIAPASGTVTRIAEEGALLRAGSELIRVDEYPGVLLYGRLPMWRPLRDGVDGADVRQLERNIQDMGLNKDGDVTIDSEFNADTTSAVKRLQREIDVDDTGVIELGQILFYPGAARVARRLVGVGDGVRAGQPLIQVTSTRRKVTARLETVQADIARVGDKVEVELPGGERVPGRVTRVGAQAERDGGPDGPTVVPITVRLAEGDGAQLYDQAPVTVTFTKERRRDVLAVPVTALLALREGGYAVEVPRAGANRLVRVTPGLFASGMVEVSGSKLREGMRIVVPA